MSSGILFELDNHVARVTLDRPKALNSIDPEMDSALFEAWTEINSNPDIWVAVLGATGRRPSAPAPTSVEGRKAMAAGWRSAVDSPASVDPCSLFVNL